MLRRLLFLLAAALPIAAANSYAPPRPLFIGSEYGAYGFKFLPRGVTARTARARDSWGELVELQADGSLKGLWNHQLVNVPGRIVISPRGDVVTLDNWAGVGSPAHAVVIYNRSGRVVADLSFSQVIPQAAACPRCQSMDGPFLTGVYQPKFTAYGQEWFLLLRDAKGHGPTISLSTGRLKTR